MKNYWLENKKEKHIIDSKKLEKTCYWEAVFYLPNGEVVLQNFKVPKRPNIKFEEVETKTGHKIIGQGRWQPLDLLNIDLKNIPVEEKKCLWNYLNKFIGVGGSKITVKLKFTYENKAIKEWQLKGVWPKQISFSETNDGTSLDLQLMFNNASYKNLTLKEGNK